MTSDNCSSITGKTVATYKAPNEEWTNWEPTEAYDKTVTLGHQIICFVGKSEIDSAVKYQSIFKVLSNRDLEESEHRQFFLSIIVSPEPVYPYWGHNLDIANFLD